MSREDRVDKFMKDIPSDVRVIAVSKKQPIDAIRELYQLGFSDFGENYLQEANEKKAALSDLDIRWHYIGSLQRKKIKDIVGRVYLIQSVASIDHLKEIEKQCQKKDCDQSILVQTNFSEEATKSGVSKAEIGALFDELPNCQRVKFSGFMEMPPPMEEAPAKEYFQSYSEFVNEFCNMRGLSVEILSLGTSGDFAAAISAGSNMIRIGTALFGPRPS